MTQIDRINGLIGSIAVKAPCRVATTANITLSGEQTIDDITVIAEDRVLVKNQTVTSENGIYDCSATSWIRAADFNGARDFTKGTLVRAIEGTANANINFEVISSGTTIDVSSIVFNGEIITSDVTYYDNIAALRAITTAPTITNATTKGYTSDGDGGGGDWYWGSTSTDTDDGGITIKATALTTGRWIRLYSGSIHAAWFGAVGGADETIEITNFFTYIGSGINGEFAGITYTITSEILAGFTNCKISGVPGATKITGSFGYSLIELDTSNDLIFEDIVFETTYVNAADDAGTSIVHCQKKVMSDITFSRCKFTGSACGCNGITFYSRTLVGDTVGIVTNLTIDSCDFEDVGRIGCTVMNRGTAADKYDAFTGFRFTNNKGKNLGLTSTFGFLLSLDGYGSGFNVNFNNIKNALGIGIENTGWIDGNFIGNHFDEHTRAYAPFGFSGNTMTGNYIAGNKTIKPSQLAAYFYDIDDSEFSSNFLETTGVAGTQFRDVNGNEFTNEHYKTDNVIACQLTSTSGNSKENTFTSCHFDTSASAANQSCFRFYGANTQGNRLVSCKTNRGTGGVFYDESSSATNNIAIDCHRDGAYSLFFNKTEYNMVADADYTLLIQQHSANRIRINDTGVVLTSGRNIIVPTTAKQYTFFNNAAQILTLKTAAFAGVAVGAGKTAVLFCDGTAVYRSTADV